MNQGVLRVSVYDDQVDSAPQENWVFAAGATIQIGRHPDNDIVLANEWVSRFHLTLFHDGECWHCASFGTNGTYYNGQAVAHLTIDGSATVRLGRRGPLVRFDAVSSPKPDEFRGTMTQLIDEMKLGDAQSFESLWARCFATIVKLARQRLGSARKRVEDEEDVAAEVFRKLYFASVEGKLPELTDRQSLWRLLMTMTRNAALDSINREQRAKRGGGHVRGDSVIGDEAFADDGSHKRGIDRFLDQAPTPSAIAAINEQVEQWLARLPDDESRQIALLRLEGYGVEEISDRLKIPLRTAERRLQQIRMAWSSKNG